MTSEERMQKTLDRIVRLAEAQLKVLERLAETNEVLVGALIDRDVEDEEQEDEGPTYLDETDEVEGADSLAPPTLN